MSAVADDTCLLAGTVVCVCPGTAGVSYFGSLLVGAVGVETHTQTERMHGIIRITVRTLGNAARTGVTTYLPT